MKDRRIGRFYLPADLVAARSPMATRIMGACSIFRAEFLYVTDSVEYMASCWLFDELLEGDNAPEYVFEFEPGGGMVARRVE